MNIRYWNWPVATVVLALLASVPQVTATAQNSLDIPTLKCGLFPAKAQDAEAMRGKQRAIIIGINKYKNYDSLVGAAPDALTIQASLTKLGFDSDVFATMNTTFALKQLVDKLGEIAGSCQKDDLLLIYFAGHGSQRGTKQYLLMSDTDPNRFAETAFDLDLLGTLLRNCKARRRVIIIDACRNTTAGASPTQPRSGESKPYMAKLTKAFQDRVDTVIRTAPAGEQVEAAVLYACDEGETSKEDAEKQSGIFTPPLSRALQGDARDDKGQITLGNVLRYVKQKIPVNANKKPIQNPTLYGKNAENMVLGILKDAPVALITKQNPKDGSTMVWIPDVEDFLPGTTEREQTLIQQLPDDQRAERLDELKKDQRPDIPINHLQIKGYWISQSLITVGQFRKFRDAMQQQGKPVSWPRVPPITEYADWGKQSDPLPMINISYEVARQYAIWAGGDLPTEEEWELAASGPQRRIYPWGDIFDPNKVRSSADGKASQGPGLSGGEHPVGISPYGVWDMAGNLWQWCTIRNTDACLHGGSWKETDPFYLRVSYRRDKSEDIALDGVIGFRIVTRGAPPQNKSELAEKNKAE